MALIGLNGGLIGKQRSTNVGAASGLWTANEQALLIRAGFWSVVSDTDTAAYIAAVEAADGQPLEDGVKAAINSFVLGCKADGIWTAIKASCILAGARTLAGALVPLVGTAPTNFNFVSGDYNRETGLLGDGSTKYLNSNRNNNADPQNSKHIAVYASTITTALNQAYIKTSYGTGFSVINTVNSTAANSSINTGASSAPSSTISGTNAIGLIGGNRNSSSAAQFRGGGTTYTNSSSTSETPRNENLTVLNGAPARLAFYSIGESLNLALLDTRVTTLINAIAAAIP
jgi:hypothetical protein